MSNIGMMEGAFFVGRKEIMDWINATLDLNLAKVEDTANGAVACQLFDIMYPNQVPMHKLNWAANKDFEFVANYKILQSCFSKNAVDRHIDVDRLISGRYMDNLEFMQWFKKFFEMSVANKGDYDAYAQRCKGKGGATYNNGGKRSVIAAKPSSAPAPKPAAVPRTLAATKSKADVKAAAKADENAAPARNVPATAAAAGASDKDKELLTVRSALDDSRKAFADLKAELEGIDKEREFYFDKLRDIEVMLQDVEEKGHGNDLTAAIFKILYATADGFEPVAEEPIAAISAMTVDTSLPVEMSEETY